MPHEIPRPKCERAHSFIAGFCGAPGCGLHVIAERQNSQPICEIIIGREAVRDLLALIHDEGLDL
jgi:hypothetical protein